MKKIGIKAIEELQVNDKIAGFVNIDWLDTDFIKHTIHIKSEKELEKIKKRLVKNGVEKVYIENYVPDKIKEIVSINEEELAEETEEHYLDLDNFTSVKEVYVELYKKTADILNDVRLGKALNYKGIQLITNTINNLIAEHGNLIGYVSKLLDFDKYTFQHSLNVGIFAGLLGKKMGFNNEQIQKLTIGGILHDIGKMFVPENILNKPDKLTYEEFEIMKEHVQKGYDYLKSLNIDDKIILNCVYDHHEKFNGAGYPNRKTDNEISIEGKIVSVIDVYDAITSNRIYKPAEDVFKTLKMLIELGDKHFSKSIVYFFVNILGVYPIKSIVLLSSDEIGIVGKVYDKDPANPVIIIFKKKDGRNIPAYFYDLHINKGKNLHKKIIGVLNPKDYPINDTIMEMIYNLNERG